MAIKNKKVYRRYRIKKRIRKIVNGTTEIPRISVFRSNSHISAQIVDDTKGETLASATSMVPSIATQKVTKSEKAKLVGQLLAERAKEAGIEKCCFDRGGYLYHGRVKSLAEGAREGGLKF